MSPPGRPTGVLLLVGVDTNHVRAHLHNFMRQPPGHFKTRNGVLQVGGEKTTNGAFIQFSRHCLVGK